MEFSSVAQYNEHYDVEENPVYNVEETTVYSYKLRAFYTLCCMRPKALHNALFDALSACASHGIEIRFTGKLDYLNSYSEENMDQFKVVECLYEILCQIHEAMYAYGYETYQHFRSYPSLRNLVIDPSGAEEFRPEERLNKNNVLRIAGIAMEMGSYEARSLALKEHCLHQGYNQSQIDEAEMNLWCESAEYLYAQEQMLMNEAHNNPSNEPVYENDDLLADVSDDEIYSMLIEPLERINAETGRRSESQQVSASLWERIKSKYGSTQQSHQEHFPDILMEGVNREYDVEESMAEVSVAVTSDGHMSWKEKLNQKYFSGLESMEDHAERGFYGYVRLFGLITIKRDIYVKNRDDIKACEELIHPFIRSVSEVYWLTREGILVAYY